MCGIAGELVLRGAAPDSTAVARMTDTMVPRGPDAGGSCVDGPVALGHRRLRIIDVSEASAQPMTDPARGLSLVYNGAIYNYRELRGELEALGHTFRSEGDTEVVLRSYAAWGSACVRRFRGMFAFALWDARRRKLVLARDRLGIKPLYIARTKDRLRFASTLPALLAGGEIDTQIDPVALNHYMSFHAVVPAPRTILRGVRKLPPATVLTVTGDGMEKAETYWSLSFAEEALSEADWRERLLASLREAVRRRTVADVPVGVLLSGGLDSSLIVGLLADAGLGDNLKTFSIGFDSVAGEEGDEFAYSDIIAHEFGTDHQRIRIDEDRTLRELPQCIRSMSEPMVSHDAIGFFLLSAEVSQHVKVVMSGQGADEVFGGYHWYPPLLESQRGAEDYCRVFLDRDYEEYARSVAEKFVGGDHASSFVTDHFASAGADKAIDRALRLDQTVMLVDDPVKRVDNMTMAWGLEARVPFLDHEVVELAARMPAALKVRDGGKYILKEAARSVIPAAVIDRPKGYFPVPALKYLRGRYLDIVRDALCSPRARARGLFNPVYVNTLLQNPEDQLTPLRGSKLWQMALLELWFQEHRL